MFLFPRGIFSERRFIIRNPVSKTLHFIKRVIFFRGGSFLNSSVFKLFFRRIPPDSSNIPRDTMIARSGFKKKKIIEYYPTISNGRGVILLLKMSIFRFGPFFFLTVEYIILITVSKTLTLESGKVACLFENGKK